MPDGTLRLHLSSLRQERKGIPCGSLLFFIFFQCLEICSEFKQFHTITHYFTIEPFVLRVGSTSGDPGYQLPTMGRASELFERILRL